ncbi:MAG: hypothetical protein V9H25_13190 [Candidatus Competibacter sp.]
MELWLALLPAASVALLFVVPGFSGVGATATLFALAAVTLAQGWWQGQSVRLKLGLLLALLGGYAIWLADAAPFAPASLLGLAPWYALQTVLLWLALGSRPAEAGCLAEWCGGSGGRGAGWPGVRAGTIADRVDPLVAGSWTGVAGVARLRRAGVSGRVGTGALAFRRGGRSAGGGRGAAVAGGSGGDSGLAAAG